MLQHYNIKREPDGKFGPIVGFYTVDSGFRVASYYISTLLLEGEPGEGLLLDGGSGAFVGAEQLEAVRNVIRNWH